MSGMAGAAVSTSAANAWLSHWPIRDGGAGGRGWQTGTPRTLTSPFGLPSPLASHRSSTLWFFPAREGQRPGLLAVVLSQGPGPPLPGLTPQNPETRSQVYKQLPREKGLQWQRGREWGGPCPRSPQPGGALSTPLEESSHHPAMHAARPAPLREQGVGTTRGPPSPWHPPRNAWVGWAGGLRVGQWAGRTQGLRLPHHLPAEGGPPAPPQAGEQAALLLRAPAGRGAVAEAGRIRAGGALLSWGWGWGRREEEAGGGGPRSPVPLEAPGPAEVKQASAPLLLQRGQRRLREARPQGPQGPRAAVWGQGELMAGRGETEMPGAEGAQGGAGGPSQASQTSPFPLT